MKPELVGHLEQVLHLADSMIALAKAGSEAAGGVNCGIIFGTLRDCGHKLKRAATAELQAEMASPAVPPPAADGPANRSADRATAPATAEGARTVLIVDDEPDVVTYLRTWFEDHGFRTTTAHNGNDAFERLAAGKPDLITLDMSMPDKSGVKTYREIRESTDFNDVPVIVITGLGQPMKQFLDRTRRVPAPEGFLSKPIELGDLAHLVRQLVG